MLIELLREFVALLERQNALLRDLKEGIQAMSGNMQSAIDDLKAQAQREDDRATAAANLIRTIPGLIEQGVAQALAQGATTAQVQSIRDITAQIAAHADDLGAAIDAQGAPAAPAAAAPAADGADPNATAPAGTPPAPEAAPAPEAPSAPAPNASA